MNAIAKSFLNALKDESGNDIAEYMLVMAAILAASPFIVSFVSSVTSKYTQITNYVNSVTVA